MKYFRNIVKNNLELIKYLSVFFVCFSFLLATALFSRGFIILGGEGDYFTDFELVRKYGSFAWAPLMNGTGAPNPILNMLIPAFDIMALFQQIGISFKILNILTVSIFYIFPFLSMFWLSNKVLKVRFGISFLVSLFYVLNPFSTYHINGMMFWNSAPLIILPLSFGILYKYYPVKKKAFVYFGLVTSLFAFSFENPPYLGIFQIFLLICAIIIPLLWEREIRWKSSIKYFLIIELSFFLFNFWWLANSLRFFWQEVGDYDLKNVSLSWMSQYVKNGDGVMNNILSFRTLLGQGDYSFLTGFYYHPLVLLILTIPFVTLVFLIFWRKYKDKTILYIFLFLLVVIFFNKGAFPPFGNIYQLCIKYIPLFELFKTPLEKFSVLLIFLFSLIFALTLNQTKNKIITAIIAGYIVVCAVPYATLNFIPDFKIGDNLYISRKFINKDEYVNSERLLNNEKTNYRYLSLPGSNNYQVTMFNRENKYYRGMDPILYAINKGFIAAYNNNYDLIYGNLSENQLENILSIYNIRKIMINKDIIPSFGFKEKESADKLDEIFSEKMTKIKNDPIIIYSINNFLPLFYTPENIVMSKREPEEISRILLRPDYNIRSVIFFESKDNFGLMQKTSLPKENFTPPSVEYKKINPVKYKIRIHKAKGLFPLIFSETFHSGWKLYLSENKNNDSSVRSLDDYKIIPGNENDQATREELIDYIKKRLVTTLGDGKEKRGDNNRSKKNRNSIQNGYAIDFISKDFFGTIQNDNLPNGKIWDTWFKAPVSEDGHLKANGYANSWIINPKDFCSNSSRCSVNPDGSFDFELIVEFQPQRMFYFGVLVSLLTAWISLGYALKDRNKEVYGDKR